jgi:hypothetical protein
MHSKTVQIFKLAALFAASAFFLYEGFSMLFEAQPDAPETELNRSR